MPMNTTEKTARLSIAAVLAAGTLALAPAQQADAEDFNYVSNALQQYVIPTTGQYEILAIGGDGGSRGGVVAGGSGASALGTFQLSAGTTLDILVAGGRNFGADAGGGGGGSFVVLDASNTPLVVAGGGGGAGGSAGLGGQAIAGAGQGGDSGVASGGGGFFGDGEDGFEGLPTGGQSYLNGGLGGNRFREGGEGSYGGGGGAALAGGGGGGYTGGEGGFDTAQGGGSYLAPSAIDPLITAGIQDGGTLDNISADGFVSINLVPEPSSLALLGLGGLIAMRRRRSA